MNTSSTPVSVKSSSVVSSVTEAAGFSPRFALVAVGGYALTGARGKGEALRRSALYVDMIRDLNRINALVVSAGYPIVDAAGLLRGSRLRQDGPS